MSVKSIYVTPRGVPYHTLSIASAFKELSPQNRLYAHYMARAGWCGLSVCASQLSPESLPILRFFHKLFDAKPVETFKKEAVRGDVTEDQVAQFLEYVALVYTNAGNYLSFGDSKFVPSCARDVFEKILANLSNKEKASPALLDAIYNLDPTQVELGFAPKGVSAYYSPNVTAEDVTLVNEYLTSKSISAINTRVWKNDSGDVFTVRIASVQEKALPLEDIGGGKKIGITYGDFKEEMKAVVDALQNAKKYAARPIQERMIDRYVEHFTTGSVDAHKESQKEWVRDVGPVVETNIGFIETYRDPSGVRAEWEGFVAVVNKDQSKKYEALVSNAESFIAQLPWGKAFEKDAFSAPDFTSLEVLGFASSGIPIGICIPNYDDIRQDFGFKNVYLANVVSAINFNDKMNHVSEEDWEVFKKVYEPAMSVGVGIHELLGHGTGKLLSEKEDGTRNFESALIDPISGKPVASWYKPGETWGSVFGGASNAYEECRAEAVALYLCVNPELLSIFGFTSEESKRDAVYVNWLSMVRAGLVGLEFYTPESKQWRQAHMRARYCILQTLLRAKNPIVTIVPDAKEGVLIKIDGDRIKTDGIQAIGELLLNLNVNKATANAERGLKYFGDLTDVSEEFVRLRGIILEKRKPRKQYVQAHTVLNADGTDAVLAEFEGSAEGVLRSMVARHRDVPL